MNDLETMREVARREIRSPRETESYLKSYAVALLLSLS
jgi:hypothetical protein